MLNIDLTNMTTEEMILLAEALGCEDMGDIGAKLDEVERRRQEKGDIPLWFVIPALWISLRDGDPSFTLAAAKAMPFETVSKLLRGIAADAPEPRAAAPRSIKRAKGKRK